MLEHLRQYAILGPLGAGRLGEVYRAKDTRIGRTVAIKVLPGAITENPVLLERLLKDASKAARLSHANVAGFLEHGEQDGRVYLVFEYAEGEKLTAAIAGRPLNVRRAVDFGIQLADALAEAHGIGVLHEDLKPDNIVVTPKGRPRILDFGFARWTEGRAARDAAAQGLPVDPAALASTVPYMSPEQALGEQVDGRSDIFSLGVVLFEMVTGRSPFATSAASSTLVQILRAQPPAPSTINPQAPPGLDLCISRALAKSLDVRYSNAALVATELRHVASEMEARAEAKPAAPPAPPPAPRRGRVAVQLALLVLLLAAGAAWTWRDEVRGAFRHWTRPNRPPVVAVVPFELTGNDASRAYFSNGFAEDLAARLGQIPGLRVVGRSSLRARRSKPPAEAGRDAQAPLVLAGTLVADRDRLTIEARLIDSQTGREVWSHRFTREMKNIVAMQAEIAEQVARELNLRLEPSPARDRTALRLVDVSGYDLYLQGREAASRGDRARAIGLFDEAVAADASLAEAYAALARALAAEQDMAGDFDLALHARITEAAGAAIAADPDLPEAQLAMGLAETGQRDAIGYLRRSVETDPSFALGYQAIGDEIAGIDPARATVFYQRSLDLDDRLSGTYRDRANAFASLGRFDESLRDIGRGQGLRPDGWWWRGMLARVQFEQGQFAKGIDIVAGPPPDNASGPLVASYAAALKMAGRGREARAVASEFRARHPNACSVSALVVALDFDEGRASDASAEAARLIEPAAAPGAMAPLYPCAAIAAAAIGDAAGTAAWLRRIAGSDEAFRQWVRSSDGSTAETGFRRRWYPWNRVAGTPAVMAAAVEIEKVRTRVRGELARLLDGLPRPERPGS